MCIQPKKIYINPKTLKHGAQMYINAKCGTCWQCVRSKQNEFIYRINEELQNCINNGGWVYYETLTYNEENVPWAKDILLKKYNIKINDEENFRCYNYDDINLYHKRLRQALKAYLGHKVNLKYFLTGEYGEKEWYFNRYGELIQGTHRPHYHILYFIEDNIAPEELMNIIHKSWGLGNTDVYYNCVQEPKPNYLSTRLWNKSNSKKGDVFINKNTRAAVYVAKYLQKDSTYIKKLNNTIENINLDNDKEVYSEYEKRLKKRKIKRYLNHCMKLSKHFGESAINKFDIDKLYETGKIELPNYEQYHVSIALPTYYENKLFKIIDENGSYRWHKEGLEYYRNKLLRNFKNTVNGIKHVIYNSNNNIGEYLKDRTIQEYATYKVFYDGRLKINKLWIPDDIVELYNTTIQINNTLTKEDITNGCTDIEYENKTYNIYDLIGMLSVNENTRQSFENYDKLNNYIWHLNKDIGLAEEKAYYDAINNKKREWTLFGNNATLS